MINYQVFLRSSTLLYGAGYNFIDIQIIHCIRDIEPISWMQLYQTKYNFDCVPELAFLVTSPAAYDYSSNVKVFQDNVNERDNILKYT